MEITARVQGLDKLLRNLEQLFPKEPRKARSMLVGSMSFAARRSIIPIAKQLARQGDGSGAISQAIKPRAVSLSRTIAAGKSASVHVTPVRGDRIAIGMYIAHYYNARGISAPASLVTSGLPHAHLVEFGFSHTSGSQFSGRPYLAPAALAGRSLYVRLFAKQLKKRIEREVKRRARRRRR